MCLAGTEVLSVGAESAGFREARGLGSEIAMVGVGPPSRLGIGVVGAVALRTAGWEATDADGSAGGVPWGTGEWRGRSARG